MKKLFVTLVIFFSFVSYSDARMVIGGTSTDTTPPTLSTATIGTNGTTWTLVFDEPVSIGAGGSDGWAVTMTTAGAVTLTYASGSGSTTLIYTGSPTVNSGDTVATGLDYTQPGDGIEDASGNDLATISSNAVVNNSTQGTGFSDNFNRADANPIGGNWTTPPAYVNAMKIVSNAAYGTSTSPNMAFWNHDSFNADQWSQATVVGNTYLNGPAVRINGTTGNCYALLVTSTNGLRLYAISSGSYYPLTSIYAISTPLGSVLKISVTGSSITCYLNGTHIADLDTTDTGITSGQPGITSYSSSPGVDDWSAGNN